MGIFKPFEARLTPSSNKATDASYKGTVRENERVNKINEIEKAQEERLESMAHDIYLAFIYPKMKEMMGLERKLQDVKNILEKIDAMKKEGQEDLEEIRKIKGFVPLVETFIQKKKNRIKARHKL